MTAAAFTFTPDADFVDRALDAELRRDSESVDRKLRTMLAALDDSLALWDAVTQLAALEEFYELKRTRTQPPVFT